ncbi:hypothetical protein ACLB2K_029455 [Fragaria x ananassa]
MASSISRTCGSPLTDDLGKYLGMPLIHTRVNKHTYDEILEKIQNKLSGWSSKTLSMAGRLTLVQSVTASIPIYAMQTAKLPLSLCESIDKANRNFLWGDSNEKKKIHLINWESVCKPKHRGGLGSKKTADMNQAMLAKASWRIFQNDPGLWADIYRKKYLQDSCIESSNFIAPADCSNTWRGIVHGVELMRRNLKWRIGDGAKIKFWCDLWIISVPSGFGVSGHDKLIWNATANGKFSVKSAYNSFFDSVGVSNPLWTHLWKLNCPPKLKTFMWSVFHQKILTNVQRVRRGFSTITSCPICKNADETLLHLLRDCPRSQAIWNSILSPGSITNYFSLDWNGWISAQFHCHVVIKNNIQWCNLFVFVCWFIWKWRNKVIFDPAFILPTCPNKVIWNYVDEWFSAQSKASMQSMFSYTMFSWCKPPENFYKLNIDGSRSSSSGCIGAGGVLRDHLGIWIDGFQVNLGTGEVLDAEAWGLFFGLRMVAMHNIVNLEIESDSAVLVQLMLKSDTGVHPLGSLLDICSVMMSKLLNVSIKHIFRECNIVADALAKNSINHDLGLISFDVVPAHAIQAVLDDLAGVTRARRTGCYSSL